MIALPDRRGGSGRRLPSLLAALALLAGCAAPQSVHDPSAGGAIVQPVIGRSGSLPEARAEAAIADAAGASDAQQRAQLEKLVDALRAATATPLVLGNKTTPLIDGPAAFRSINEAIAAARHSIHIETYIYADDDLGSAFSEQLIKKCREGVQVRVIYDGVGSFSTPASFFDRMREAGIELTEFRPFNPIKTLPWRYHNRDHRKIIVIDGKVAFTGGMNITGAYAAGSSSRPGPVAGMTEAWRDTQVRIEGPAVQQFQTAFLDTWQRLDNKIDSREQYFPAAPAAGEDVVAAVMSSGARAQDEAIYHTYLGAIDSATERIWLTQAYFAPPPEMLDALLAAAHRGVDVRVIVPGFSDAGLVLNASRAGYERLLRGGVRLFEKSDAFLHAKTAVIDGAVSLIGSANLDYRSFLHNNEVTAVIIGRAPSKYMETSFMADMKHADELTLEEWSKRPAEQRFKEWFSGLFKYWL